MSEQLNEIKSKLSAISETLEPKYLDHDLHRVLDLVNDTTDLVDHLPILEPWQVDAVQDILGNHIAPLPSNGTHTRFCTEPQQEHQWHMTHHFMDLDGTSPLYSELTITQFSTDGSATQVQLSHNEVDDLLTVLLKWRMDAEKQGYENLLKVKQQETEYAIQKSGDFQSDDALGPLDDHPF